MTTIAWDGKVLATDKGGWLGDVVIPCKKLWRVDTNTIAACAGPHWMTVKLLAYLRGERFDPMYDKADDGGLLVVRRRGRTARVSILNMALSEDPMTLPFMAMGAGKEMAFGALAAGASAKQAIQIVLKHGSGAALGVDTLTL